MTYIRTISPHEAHGDVRAMYERQRAHYGYVPNYARVFSHRPDVLKRWAALLSEIRRPLDARRFELVTLAAAQALRNTYCSLAHARALGALAGTDEVAAVVRDELPGPLSDTDTAIVRYARKVARDATTVDAEDIDALAAHGLTDAEIFDIAATVAARAFFARLLDALGVKADAALHDVDEPIRRALDFHAESDRRLGEHLPGDAEAGTETQHREQP